MTQEQFASDFRQLHSARPLVLPNAWDPLSARFISEAGARAIATTSAGVSWAHGLPDGQHLSRDQAIAAIKSIVDVVDVPVTADIEGGYGSSKPEDVFETVSAVLLAGAVGVNIEDSPGLDGAPLVSPAFQCARIQAARAAAKEANVDLFINARIDVYFTENDDASLTKVLNRARQYRDAGADGIFVPGVTDSGLIQALVSGIDLPLNVMVGPGSLSPGALAEIGVARVSLGPTIIVAALGFVKNAVSDLLQSGSYSSFEQGLSFSSINETLRHD